MIFFVSVAILRSWRKATEEALDHKDEDLELAVGGLLQKVGLEVWLQSGDFLDDLHFIVAVTFVNLIYIMQMFFIVKEERQI